MQEFSVKQSNLDFRTREAYKMLRTNIEFSGDNNKVIFITSSTPSEGKSTVSFELAMSFAQNGMKTLLIDADTRKSVMKNRGKKGKIKYGLTHYLSGKNELKDVICVSDVPNFCMIFAGPVPPNPSELVGNDRFAKMVEEAREKFIKGNLRLVLSIIQRFGAAGENSDDLFQIGCVGLMKAIDHFDVTMNVKFSTYAVPMIIGEIRRY